MTVNPSIESAVRLACLAEVHAEKPGNVSPTRTFDDIAIADFVKSAKAVAPILGTASTRTVGESILQAIRATRNAVDSNTNLGIVLLLGPLVMAAEQLPEQAEHIAVDTERLAVDTNWANRDFNGLPDRTAMRHAAERVIDAIDPAQSEQIYDAIRLAKPGGMGQVESMDVNSPPPEPPSIHAAMESAKSRDRIALQYATGFADLFDNVVPVLKTAITEAEDMLDGICVAQIRLLAAAPDSLIARKCGTATAAEVQTWAKQTDPTSKRQRDELDRRLRSDGHRLNPGTTADLIAAGLFVLLSSECR